MKFRPWGVTSGRAILPVDLSVIALGVAGGMAGQRLTGERRIV